ncbi:MAG: nucleotide exchange factor GrpE [Ruminococcaceae bacterium]|nr:nucleotide exchange factor GrpE [Oscillospiraceae bacterium]
MAENEKTTNEEVTEEVTEEVKEEIPETPTEEKEVSEEEKLKVEYAALYDKYLRLAAEFDNFKKRTQKEKEEIYLVAKTDVVMNLLPVIDNFDRAEKFASDKNVEEGIALIKKQFTEFLKKIGIEEIDAENKPFDPNFHNAVLHEDRDDLPENTIVEVLQKGYKLGDKVIRYAMVKVAN